MKEIKEVEQHIAPEKIKSENKARGPVQGERNQKVAGKLRERLRNQGNMRSKPVHAGGYYFENKNVLTACTSQTPSCPSQDTTEIFQ